MIIETKYYLFYFMARLAFKQNLYYQFVILDELYTKNTMVVS